MTPPDPLPVLLAPFFARPDHTGIMCDFDGTLSTIVDDPARARPVPGAVALLGRLTTQYRTVAVVSGRPVAFLREHLGGRGLVLCGLYGLERLRGTEIEEVEGAGAWRPVVAEVTARAEGPDGPGVDVEPKGLSVTLHYRNWPDREAGRARVGRRRGGSHRAPRPSGAPLLRVAATDQDRDKGSVVRELAAGLDAACFLGDDDGDLAAFDALDALERDGLFALRVGVRQLRGPGRDPRAFRRAGRRARGGVGAARAAQPLNC